MSTETFQPAEPSRPAGFRDGWRGARLRARAVAATCHLLLSLLVCGSLAGVVLWAMYPAPYFAAAGGGRLLAMIAVVDLCLGPALTFAVFDTRKRSLRMDLALVALVQVAALGYGLHALSLGRPVFLTWSVDRFELVSAAEVDPRELADAPQAFRTLSWRGPLTAATRLPDTDAEREQLNALVMAGMDLRHLIHRYQPFATAAGEVRARARPLDALAGFNAAADIDHALREAGLAERRDAVRWVPVAGRHRDLVAFVDVDRGELPRVVRLQPW